MLMQWNRWARMAGVMLLVAGSLTMASGGPVDAQVAGCTQFRVLDNTSVVPSPLFQNPNGVHADDAGNIFVVDHNSLALYGFDSAGNQIMEVHSGSNPPSPAFNRPNGVTVDADGNVYVSDENIDVVWGFRPDGTQFMTIENSSPNPPSPAWFSPEDVEVDSAGNIYVTDNESVYKFDPNGVQLFRFHAGSTPAAPFISGGQLSLDFDDSDNMFVTQNNPGTVFGFRPDYTQFLAIDNSSPGGPNPPFSVFGLGVSGGLAVDGSGNIFVTDAQDERVYGFRSDGTQFLTISAGLTNPPASFGHPLGLDTDNAGNLYVTDLESNTAPGRVHGFTCPPAAGNVEVTVAAGPAPTVCVTLDTTFIDFGTLAFGDTSAPVATTLNNCGDDVDLTAAISDAAGATAAWSPDNGGTDTCAAGTDLFAYQLDDGTTSPVLLDNTPTALSGQLVSGADRTDSHTLYMPCTGSTGDGNETVNMVFQYVASLAP